MITSRSIVVSDRNLQITAYTKLKKNRSAVLYPSPGLVWTRSDPLQSEYVLGGIEVENLFIPTPIHVNGKGIGLPKQSLNPPYPGKKKTFLTKPVNFQTDGTQSRPANGATPTPTQKLWELNYKPTPTQNPSQVTRPAHSARVHPRSCAWV